MAKVLLVIAGANGSGKTTFYRKLVKKYPPVLNLLMINPDEMAKERFGDYITKTDSNSNQKMLKIAKEVVLLRKNFIKEDKSFAFETTLSGNSEINIIKQAFENEYNIYFIYLGVEEPLLNVLRVKSRVLMGGHVVKTKDINRRYFRSFKNLGKVVKMVKSMFIIDNSGKRYRLIYSKRKNKNKTYIVKDKSLPRWFKKYIEGKI